MLVKLITLRSIPAKLVSNVWVSTLVRISDMSTTSRFHGWVIFQNLKFKSRTFKRVKIVLFVVIQLSWRIDQSHHLHLNVRRYWYFKHIRHISDYWCYLRRSICKDQPTRFNFSTFYFIAARPPLELLDRIFWFFLKSTLVIKNYVLFSLDLQFWRHTCCKKKREVRNKRVSVIINRTP